MTAPPNPLDVELATPLGPMPARVTAAGVYALQFPPPPAAAAPAAPLAGPVRWRLSHRPAARPTPRHLLHVEQLVSWLLAYFSGTAPAALPALDMAGLTPFTQTVLRLLGEVPWGGTTTYGALAAAAGSPGGARAVGGVMRANRHVLLLPCHRVLAAPGPGGAARLGGFSGGPGLKPRLLAWERGEKG